jgi:hypothetical protein
MAFYGTFSSLVEVVNFPGKLAFCESQGASIIACRFHGKGAFSETAKINFNGGIVSDPNFGITSRQMIIKGGGFSDPGFMKYIQNALILCSRAN